MNNRRRYVTRIVAMLLAALMIVSTLVSGLSLLVSAASINPTVTVYKKGTSTDVDGVLRNGEAYDLNLYYTEMDAGLSDKQTIDFESKDVFIPSSSILYTTGSKAKLRVERIATDADGNNKFYISLTIYGVVYKKDGGSLDIVLSGEEYSCEINSVDIPDKYTSSTSSDGNSGSSDDPTTYTPLIMVENAVALDSNGNRIDEVTKDTPSFTLEIVYADMGLQDVDFDEMDYSDMQAFFSNNTSFEIGGSTKGSVRLASNTTWDYPRFRATFTGVTYTGVGKDIDFKIFYRFPDSDSLTGADGKTILTAAKVDKEEEDEKKMKLPAPKIIISSYTYGQDTIVAGSEFRLDFSITNTSAELPVENVVVTLTPASNEAATKGPGLIVASSSNTIYVPLLEAGASQSYSVAFQARPDAEVTSHLITVRFSYEYVDTNQEERVTVPDLSESIAIPVSQIDRFSVDPISDAVYGMVGEEVYLTISFINKGKSSTNNISGTIRSDNPALSAPGQHYGNLEAGKADTLDLYLTASSPGEFTGDVVITYEDENNNEKEITTPFVLTIEEPYYPPMEPQTPSEGMEPPPAQGPGTLTIVLCAVGGLAIAVPIALYLMKRVKAKGSEDFDEVF